MPDPLGWAKTRVEEALYWLDIVDRPFGPKEEDIGEMARAAVKKRSPEQARTVIDSIIGREPGDEYVLEMLQDKGWVARALLGERAGEQPYLALEPFSESGQSLLATNAFQQQFKMDPWMLSDTFMQGVIDENPRVMWLYMRETDPLAMMPVVVEQDIEKAGAGGGSRWKNPILDLGGRILDGGKRFAWSLINMPLRVEETIGWHIYNDIPDPTLRLQMGQNAWRYRLNLADWSQRAEADALVKVEEILRGGLRGEEAGAEFEKYLEENQPGGLAGSIAQVVGWIVYDPLWLLPVGKIAQLTVGMPVKAATKVPTTGRFARFLSPAARAAKAAAPEGRYTWLQIMRMPEVSYAALKATKAGRGPLSFVFERDPGAFGRLARRQLHARVSPYMDEIVDTLAAGDSRMLDELVDTFRTAKPKGWVAKRLPDLLDDPALADFSRRAAGKTKGDFGATLTKNLAARTESPFWEGISRFQNIASELVEHGAGRGLLGDAVAHRVVALGDELIAAAPKGARQQARSPLQQLGTRVRQAGVAGSRDKLRTAATEFAELTRRARIETVEGVLLESVDTAMVQAQRTIFRHTTMGRFLVDRWMPFTAGMRQAVASVTINNPAFAIQLNLINNFTTFMWTMARNPIRAARLYAKSVFGEVSTVLPMGGRYADEFVEILAPHPGLTPRRVEQFVASQTGMHEWLGVRIAQKDFGAEEFLEVLGKQVQEPIRHLFEQPRRVFGLNLDKIMYPVYAAGRLDAAARRAAFLAALKEQAGMLAVPAMVARGPAPDLAAKLREVGVSADDAVRIEHALLDEYRGFMTGVTPVPAGKTPQTAFLERVNALEVQVRGGVQEAGFSVGDVAWRWAKAPPPEGLGLMDDAAARLALNDIWPFADTIRKEVLQPHLGEVIAGKRTLKSLERMIDATVMEYYGAADVLAQINRLPNMIRNPTSYLDGLRLSNRVMIEDMADNILHVERHMRGMFPGWNKDPKNWPMIRRFNDLGAEATAGLARRREGINRLYQQAARHGDEIAEFTPDLAKAWDDYFATKDKAFEDLYEFIRGETAKVSTAHTKLVDDWYEALTKTHRRHQANLLDAAREGTEEAWRAAGEANKLLYETNAKARGALFGHGANDPPAAQQVFDMAGPLAKEVDLYAATLKSELRKAMPAMKKGELALATPLREQAVTEMRKAAQEVVNNWEAASRQAVSQAQVKTDFIMLNYNNQFGFDRLFQAFAPFFFWPTRTAVHWGIRAARQPGAFVGIWQAILFPSRLVEQYDLPMRYQFAVPIPIPGMDEALRNVPFVADMFADSNFSPLYFVDPLSVMFPFAQWRDLYDDERRHNTPAGLLLDFAESYAPMVSINPFMKIIGSNTGLLDRDAWASTQFSGGPYGFPLSAAGLLTARFLHGGDLDAIPEEEMYTYTDKGHFSIPWLGRVLNLEPDGFDIYRAERAVWALAATDELLPGKDHETQVRAAWEAVRDHRGVAWAKATRAARGVDFLRAATAWIGYPLGGIRGMHEGEYIYAGLRTAYSEYARQGRLEEFYEKYPEFEVRRAVVSGLSDPEEKAQAIDTALFYEDLERIVEEPFRGALEGITGKLHYLAQQTQTDWTREEVRFYEAEFSAVRAEQSRLRKIVEGMYPNRDTTLSFFHPPRNYALRTVDDEWYALRNEWYSNEGAAGESYDNLVIRQQEWLDQFPLYGEGGYTERGWQNAFTEYMLLRIQYSRAMEKAIREERWEDRDALQEELKAKLESQHAKWGANLTRRDVESHLASRLGPRTPEQVEFEKARALRELWMSLVSSGSPFTSRERAAISDYFRSLPEIQKHYPFKAAPLEAFTAEQRLAMLRRDEIWDTYYSFSDPEVQVDYVKSISGELNEINQMLGLPPLRIMDYRVPPPELGAGDPFVSRMQFARTAAREEILRTEGENIPPELLDEYTDLLAMDPDDSSPLSSGDLDWLIEQWAAPDVETE